MDANRLQQEIEVLLLLSEGEIIPEIDELMKLQLKAENLEQNIAWLLIKYEANEALLKARSDRLESLKRKIETTKGSSEYWKGKITEELQRSGLPSLKLRDYDLSFLRSESVDVYDETELPDEYIKTTTKVTKAPDKITIKAALKSGKNVPGAKLEVKNNLQIKS